MNSRHGSLIIGALPFFPMQIEAQIGESKVIPNLNCSKTVSTVQVHKLFLSFFMQIYQIRTTGIIRDKMK